MTDWIFHARKSAMHDHSSKTTAETASSDDFWNDPLSDILRGLRLDGVRYGRCILEAPWGVEHPDLPAARLYFLAVGNASFKVGEDWHELRCGDAVLLPRGGPHVIASAPDAPTCRFTGYKVTSVCDKLVEVRSEGDEAAASTILFSASMRFNVDLQHPLLTLMPDVMYAHDLNGKEPSVRPLLDAMAAEVKLDRVGSGGMLARLADVLAATLVRVWIESGCGDARGWLAAVRDPQIGRALAAVHRDPGADWSVEQLARLAGASRSGFALRFADLVGVTPAHYVAQTRMHQAKQWFQRDRAAISSVASRLGYESEASFSRAFKRVIGMPPSHFREAGAADSGAPLIP